jgi:hypothetical protein
MPFAGTNPGPLMVVHEGDYVELTLKNPSANLLVHNIDFHKGHCLHKSPWINYNFLLLNDHFHFNNSRFTRIALLVFWQGLWVEVP